MQNKIIILAPQIWVYSTAPGSHFAEVVETSVLSVSAPATVLAGAIYVHSLTDIFVSTITARSVDMTVKLLHTNVV